MSINLYLIETKARSAYLCAGCGNDIPRGGKHFRHDPHPYARQFRGQPTTHWCRGCILASYPIQKESVSGRIRVPAVRVLGRTLTERQHAELSSRKRLPILPLFQPVHIELIQVSDALLKLLVKDPTLLHNLPPHRFEEFVCDRLFAMGFEPRKVGLINQKDGGVDIVFWPRGEVSFPFLGAAQIKHHRNPEVKEGPSTVREFAGAISAHAFNAGVIVTNTSFSPDAKWFAREHARLVRLRDFNDICRWIAGTFADEAEWREIPHSIELCPGTVIKIR